jgi:BMFP domain-containing protein YqiC
MAEKDNNKDKNIPDPFYHESEEYTSAFFGKVPEKVFETFPAKADEKTKAELVNQLTNPELRELRPDVLSLLKENESQQLLLDVISDEDFEKQRPALIAACWETGLDFSKHLEKFIDLLGDKSTNDFSAIEIATVIDEMPGPFDEKVLEKCLRQLESFSVKEPLKREMLNGIALRLRAFGK